MMKIENFQHAKNLRFLSMKKALLLIVLMITIFMLSLQPALSYNLSNLEDAFVKDGAITCYVVVGDKAASANVIAQLDVIKYLSEHSNSSGMGISKLASDIDDIYERDIISIGSPCINNVTRDIMDYDGGCIFEQGLMRFYNKNGKTQLVIYGVSDASTRTAATSITQKEVSGEEEFIEPTTEEKVEIERQKAILALAEGARQEKEEGEEAGLMPAEEDTMGVIEAVEPEKTEFNINSRYWDLAIVLAIIVASLILFGCKKNKGIDAYVANAARKGYNKNIIAQKLLKGGYSKKEIEKAMKGAK